MSFPPSNDLHKPPAEGKFTLVLHVVAKSKEAADQVIAGIKKIQAHVKANEPETLEYRIHQSEDDGKTILVYEEYASAAALAKHASNPEVGALLGSASSAADLLHVRYFQEK